MDRVQEQDSSGLVAWGETSRLESARVLAAGTAAAATTAIAPSALALTQGFPIGPEPIRYPSGVWKVLDDRFRKYMIGNTPLVRNGPVRCGPRDRPGTGSGDTWSSATSRNNRQLRWDEVTGKVTPVPHPVELLQRQHVRLAGTAALVRAPDGAGRALRVSTASRRCSRRRSRGSASTRRTTSSCIRRAAASSSPTRATAVTGTTRAPSASWSCRPASTTSTRRAAGSRS